MKKLSFGALCSAFEAIKPRNTWVPYIMIGNKTCIKQKLAQNDVVSLFYSMVCPEDQWNDDILAVEANHASDIISNKRNIASDIRKLAQIADENLVAHNVREHLVNFLSPEQSRSFWEKLQVLVHNTPLGDDQFKLKDFETAEYSVDTFHLYLTYIVLWTLLAPNTISTEFHPGDDALWPPLPVNREHYDPYSRSSYLSNSTALTIKLIPESGKTQVFYCRERALEVIFKRNYLINRIGFEPRTIKLFCQRDDNFLIKRLEKKHYCLAKNFIHGHLNEFKPKLSWRKRELSDMAYNGLYTGKWTAYGIFNKEQQLISYLDYKTRSDSAIELGIQLTDEKYRNKALATSLINLFRFMFMENCLYAGTYEENIAMSLVFEKCEFLPSYFYDSEAKIKTNRIRERIDVSQPDNMNALTSSVYFHSQSLLSRMHNYTMVSVGQI